MTTRRSFITGLVSFVAAPAIVRASSLMPVKAELLNHDAILKAWIDHAWRQACPPYGVSPIMQAFPAAVWRSFNEPVESSATCASIAAAPTILHPEAISALL